MKPSSVIRDRFSRDPSPEKTWPSVVLLLRTSDLLPESEVLRLADAAWGLNEPAGRFSPKIVGTRKDGVTFQLAPRTFTSVFQVSERYVSQTVERNEPSNEPKARMWAEHKAWFAVDAANCYDLAPQERKQCYKILFHFVNKMWNSNVCGLYLPAEELQSPTVMPSQIPNLGDLIYSIKWSAANQSHSRVAKATADSGYPQS